MLRCYGSIAILLRAFPSADYDFTPMCQKTGIYDEQFAWSIKRFLRCDKIHITDEMDSSHCWLHTGLDGNSGETDTSGTKCRLSETRIPFSRRSPYLGLSLQYCPCESQGPFSGVSVCIWNARNSTGNPCCLDTNIDDVQGQRTAQGHEVPKLFRGILKV